MTRYLIVILVLSLCIYACETVVQLDVPHKENQLVVNSFFHPDSTFGLSLSQSQFVLDSGEFEKVTGATAILMDGQDNKLTTMQEHESGIYLSDLKPKPGNTYRIKVSKSGFTSASATDKVPEDSARMTKYQVKRNPNSPRSIRLSIWIDDSENKDYYQLYGMEKVTLFGEEIDTTTYEEEMFFASDDPIFGDQSNTGRIFFFDDALFNGKTHKINLDTSVGSTQCTPEADICDQEVEVTLYIRKISEAYFKYLRTSDLQNDLSDNPFAEPVPVFDNIENGLGIFGGYRVSEYPIEIPED